MYPSKTLKTLLLAVVALSTAVCAQAQIGTGWTSYNPTKKLQKENSEGYSSYEMKNGVETFKLWRNPSGARQRIEWRVNDNYTSGSTQFQGEFYVVKGGGPDIDDDVCIMQVWLSLIVSVSDVNGGTLKAGSARVANIKGKWVKLNVMHNADKNEVEVWIDGKRVHAGKSKDSNPFYHKYGLYNCAEAKPIVQWRNVKFFKKGNTGL